MSEKIYFSVKFVRVDLPKHGVLEDMIWGYFASSNQKSQMVVQCSVCGRKLRTNLKMDLQKHLKTHETSWREFLDTISSALNMISTSSAYKGQALKCAVQLGEMTLRLPLSRVEQRSDPETSSKLGRI